MTDVPALTRGLQLLELLAQADGAVAFSELLARLELPRASLARLLAALHETGWIERDGENGWRPGARVRALAAPVDRARRLRAAALPALRELQQELDASLLLAVPRGAALDVLISLTAEEGVALRPEGAVIDDLSRGPWGGVAHASLAGALAEAATARAGGAGTRRLAAMAAQLAERGCVADPGGGRAGVLRVAVPVAAGDRLLAVLGAGAPLGQLDEAVLARRLRTAAAQLAGTCGDLP